MKYLRHETMNKSLRKQGCPTFLAVFFLDEPKALAQI
jgi:hypothetical protein